MSKNNRFFVPLIITILFCSGILFFYISNYFISKQDNKLDNKAVKLEYKFENPIEFDRIDIDHDPDYTQDGIDLILNLTSSLIRYEQTDLEKAIILTNFTYFYLDRLKYPYNGSQAVYCILKNKYGQCPQYSCVLVGACQVYGLEARRMGLTDNGDLSNAHTIAEVKIGGKWRIFDPLFNIFLNHSILEFHTFNLSTRQAILNKTYDSMNLKQDYATREGIISLSIYYAGFMKFVEDPNIFDSYRCHYTEIYNDGEIEEIPINLDLSWYS